MPKTTFLATDPNGKVHTRTSQSRQYTHVVVARASYQHALATAEVAGDEAHVASNYAYYSKKPDGAASLKGAKSLSEYQAQYRDTALALVAQRKAAGYYETFFDQGWAGRPDLAASKAQSVGSKPWIAEVLALPVTVKPAKGR